MNNVTKVLRALMKADASETELRRVVNEKRWAKYSSMGFNRFMHDMVVLSQLATEERSEGKATTYSITALGREEFYDRTT